MCTSSAMNFPLSTTLDICHKFWCVMTSFSFSLIYSLLPTPCFWPINYLEECSFVSICLEILLLFFYCWFLVWFYYDRFSTLLQFLRSPYGPGYGLPMYVFHGQLKRMCIQLLLGRLFHKWQIDALVYGVVEMFYNFAYFLSRCCFNCEEKGAEVSIYIIDLFFISLISFFCLHLSCSSVVWCICIHLGLLLLFVEWPFYHYIMSFSVSGNFLCSEIHFT